MWWWLLLVLVSSLVPVFLWDRAERNINKAIKAIIKKVNPQLHVVQFKLSFRRNLWEKEDPINQDTLVYASFVKHLRYLLQTVRCSFISKYYSQHGWYLEMIRVSTLLSWYSPFSGNFSASNRLGVQLLLKRFGNLIFFKVFEIQLFSCLFSFTAVCHLCIYLDKHVFELYLCVWKIILCFSKYIYLQTFVGISKITG